MKIYLALILAPFSCIAQEIDAAKQYIDFGNNCFADDPLLVEKYLKEGALNITSLQEKTEKLADDAYKLALAYDFGYKVPESNSKALFWYWQAAEKGQPKAQYIMGYRYQFGKDNTPKHAEQAKNWYQRAIENGEICANYGLGSILSDSKEYKKALSYIERAAIKGVTGAQYTLAMMYKNGEGVKENKSSALTWMKKASDGDNFEASLKVGIWYADGVFGEENKPKSVPYLEKASDSGKLWATHILGKLYMKGKYVTQDVDRAESYLIRTKESNPESYVLIASKYFSKEFGVVDGKKALYWLKKGAEANSKDATGILGLMYLESEGLFPKDTEKAVYYLNKAGELGASLKTEKYLKQTLGKLETKTHTGRNAAVYESMDTASNKIENVSDGNEYILVKQHEEWASVYLPEKKVFGYIKTTKG